MIQEKGGGDRELFMRHREMLCILPSNPVFLFLITALLKGLNGNSVSTSEGHSLVLIVLENLESIIITDKY
jgi:hypothetical protein